MIVTYPISQGRLLNVAVMTFDYAREGSLHPQPWVTLAKADELTPLVSGWAPELRYIVAVSHLPLCLLTLLLG